jgi:hypothetical protein
VDNQNQPTRQDNRFYRWAANGSVGLALFSIGCIVLAIVTANAGLSEFLSFVFPLLIVLSVLGVIAGSIGFRTREYRGRSILGFMVNLALLIIWVLTLLGPIIGTRGNAD